MPNCCKLNHVTEGGGKHPLFTGTWEVDVKGDVIQCFDLGKTMCLREDLI